MRTFAIICGIFLGVVLAVIGWSMTGSGETESYALPMRFGIAALIFLPLGYWGIAARRLPRPAALAVAIAMMAVLAILWLPLVNDSAMWTVHWPRLAIFTGVWVVAILPFIRAAIRHRPR